MPVTVNIDEKYVYLGEFGPTGNAQAAIVATREEIEETVYRAGKYSVYSVEEQIRRGFLTAENGERIGLAGEYVYERGQVLAIRNFSSLCIRIPHEIVGCANEIYKRCFLEGVKNTLIMSPPGIGKTTILRDLCRRLSEETEKNILVCDERGELSALPIGKTADVLRFADKTTAFEAGIRALKPDIMITDELSFSDQKAVERAVLSGVKLIASAHFSSIEALAPPFSDLFEYYVLLDEKKIGRIKGIYGENLKELTV